MQSLRHNFARFSLHQLLPHLSRVWPCSRVKLRAGCQLCKEPFSECKLEMLCRPLTHFIIIYIYIHCHIIISYIYHIYIHIYTYISSLFLLISTTFWDFTGVFRPRCGSSVILGVPFGSRRSFTWTRMWWSREISWSFSTSQ